MNGNVNSGKRSYLQTNPQTHGCIVKITGWWLESWNFIFPHIGKFITPTDFHSIIFQRGRSTTNLIMSVNSAKWWFNGFGVACLQDKASDVSWHIMATSHTPERLVNIAVARAVLPESRGSSQSWGLLSQYYPIFIKRHSHQSKFHMIISTKEDSRQLQEWHILTIINSILTTY